MLITDPYLLCDSCMDKIEEGTLVYMVFGGVLEGVEIADFVKPEPILTPSTMTEHHYHYTCYAQREGKK
jgi:hypothetical protein